MPRTLLIYAFQTLGAFQKSDIQPNQLKSGIHSGNVGDIIYALPTCRALGIKHLYLNVFTDPLAEVRNLTEETCLALVPLLMAQEYIEAVTIVTSYMGLENIPEDALGVDYNLDKFRFVARKQPNLHLAYMHSQAFGVTVDLNEAWLILPETASSPILRTSFLSANLTPRYRRFDISFYERIFRGLNSSELVWVGLPADQSCRRGLPGDARQLDDFLQLAQLLSQSAGFIGNPSMPYALAEALKIPRLVEVPTSGNVYPLGPQGELLHQYGETEIQALINQWLNDQEKLAGRTRSHGELLSRGRLQEECLKLESAIQQLNEEYLVLVQEIKEANHQKIRFESSLRQNLSSQTDSHTDLYHALNKLKKQHAEISQSVEQWNSRLG